MGMNWGFSFIILVIWFGWRRLMSVLNASSRKLTWRSAWFWSFGRLTEFTVFLIGPNGERTAFFIDAIMPFLIENIQSQTRRKRLKCWSIHMDNARLHNPARAQSCIEASRAERLPHSAQTQTRLRVISFSLDISKENYLITIVRAEMTS
jgi:hypothetical protein